MVWFSEGHEKESAIFHCLNQRWYLVLRKRLAVRVDVTRMDRNTHQELSIHQQAEEVVCLTDLDGRIEAGHAVVAGVLDSQGSSAGRMCALSSALRGEEYGIYRCERVSPCAHYRKHLLCTHSWAASNSEQRRHPGKMT
jgi:hypothetical protein